MTNLVKYSPDKEIETVKRIVDFFGYHDSLINLKKDISEDDYKEALEIIVEWQSNDSVLYIVYFNDASVGFLRIRYRGPIVAWIEDIYIDAAYRGKGIATEAIRLAENIVKSNPGYEAICFDVVPRNTEAINLYYKLGYTDLSIITLRKEFGQSKRDQVVNMLGKDFNY